MSRERTSRNTQWNVILKGNQPNNCNTTLEVSENGWWSLEVISEIKLFTALLASSLKTTKFAIMKTPNVNNENIISPIPVQTNRWQKKEIWNVEQTVKPEVYYRSDADGALKCRSVVSYSNMRRNKSTIWLKSGNDEYSVFKTRCFFRDHKSVSLQG